MAEIDSRLQALAVQVLPEWELADAHLEPIGISENATFRIDTPDKQYVMRIHRPGYHTFTELESEHVWTAALRKAGLDVPVPVRTRGDNVYVTIPFEEDERHIDMLEWVDGELLGDIIQRESGCYAGHFRATGRIQRESGCYTGHFRATGRIAAAMHNQSSAWTLPSGFERQRFDIEGLMGDDPFWGPFWDLPQMSKAQRDVIKSARRTITEELMCLGYSPETFSLIHADLHPHNLVVSDHGLHVIDFDDCGFGWHHYELAVALYRYRELDRYEDMLAAMVDGYREVRPLSDTVVTMLPVFYLVRSLVHLGWSAARPEHGEDLSDSIDHTVRQAREWMG